MKSRSLQRTRRAPALPSWRWSPQNTLNFPQALRDAIPALPHCWGRCLVLAAITGHAVHNRLWGRRVRLKFQVQETGKLTGKFDVWMDLDAGAARALARTLDQLAAQAENAPPANA